MRWTSVIAVIACACLTGCGGSPRSASTSTPSTVSATSSTVAAAPAVAPGPVHPPPVRRAANPCPSRSSLALEQTAALPSTKTPCFRAVVRALWRAIQAGSTRGAVYAFFPLRAYEQVKAIGDPRGDYTGRLLADYVLDLRAALEVLGPGARAARLVHAIVPAGYVHWVPPGACYNRLGYYEVPNARLVYRVAGHMRSFGIASMIAWRGTWYVVHLGAVTRTGEDGVVDDPSDGPGTSEPSLTC